MLLRVFLLTEKILRQLGYSPAKIEAVKHCIASHRGSLPTARNSAEAECLANADAVTHIEQAPSLLHLAFGQRGVEINEGSQWVREKLERSWNKLSPLVQALMRERYQAVLQVLTANRANL